MDKKRSHALELSVLTGDNLSENLEINEGVTTISTYNDNGECAGGNFSSEMFHENATLHLESEDSHPPVDVNQNTLVTSRENGTDSNESHRRPSVTIMDLLFLFLPILSHVYDLGSDLWLAINYFSSERNAYGCFTLALIGIPSAASTWISSRMRKDDSQVSDYNARRLIPVFRRVFGKFRMSTNKGENQRHR